jgi:CTP:molybdopterin cytidylyltransferase MocA
MGIAPAPTLAVLLAAGGGSRFEGDTHKLWAELDGEPLAGRALRHALESDIGPVLVVTGATDLGELLTRIAAESGRSVITVHNTLWADGQATSLRSAIDEAGRRGADAIVVGLADQPFVDPEAWRRVAASSAPIAVATYGGRRRNPVRLHRSVWPLISGVGDEGARHLARVRPELVEEIPCPGSAVDIDTLEDLQSWQNRSSTNSP